jgi:LPXTG-motif cell wall-anchored protein
MRLGRRALVTALAALLLGAGAAAPALAAPGTAPAAALVAEPTDPSAPADPAVSDPAAPDAGPACLTPGTQDGYAPSGRCELVIARAVAVCLEDVPYLQYSLEAFGTPNTTATLTWVDPGGKSVVQSGLPLTGQVVWPGVVFENGKVVDWPGWSKTADGTWVQHDEFDFTRPDVTIRFQVNPEASTVVSYPAASTTCNGPAGVTPTVVTRSQVLSAPDDVTGGTGAAGVADVAAGVTYRSQVLAATGSNSWQLAAAGGATVLVGLTLVLLATRRNHRTR